MKRLAAVMFAAAHILCTQAGPVQEAPVRSYARRKCVWRIPWMAGEVVSRCTYRCLEWPLDWENEQDGVPCREVPNGVCVNGRCVDGDSYRSTHTFTPSPTSLTKSYKNAQTNSNSDASTDLPSVHERESSVTIYSDDQPSRKPEVRSTTDKSWTGRRQTSQPVSTTPRPYQHSLSPSFPTIYRARTTTPKYPISGVSTVSEGTASNMNNKATQPFSRMTRFAEITTNRNQQTASESTSTSPSFKPSEQHASTRAHYDENHAEEPSPTEDSSRGRSSMLSRHLSFSPIPAGEARSVTHVTEKPTQNESGYSTRSTFSGPLTTPSVPASEASNPTPAIPSDSMLPNETPGVAATPSQPKTNSARTSTPPTTDAAFTSMRRGGTSASPDTDPAATVISHEHVSGRHPTTTCSDLSSNVWSTRDESRAVSGGPRVTSSTERDVTEATVASHEFTEIGSVTPATTSGTTPPTNRVAPLQTRDPSSFELSIEINVKGRLPFLKH